MNQNFKISVMLFLLLVSGPALSQSDFESKKIFVFNSAFNDVWNAAQLILGSYPLETNDQKNGIIRTTELKPGQFWQAPFEKKLEENYAQTLVFQFFKLNPKTTQVEIIKKAKVQTDFLGSERNITVESWEELRLVYKIKREIKIKSILNQLK
jgi:hypothetical protein